MIFKNKLFFQMKKFMIKDMIKWLKERRACILNRQFVKKLNQKYLNEIIYVRFYQFYMIVFSFLLKFFFFLFKYYSKKYIAYYKKNIKLK